MRDGVTTIEVKSGYGLDLANERKMLRVARRLADELPLAVRADWAPYRHGRWAWVRPWGWTWIDAAPWGFAPFHYGSWVRYGGHWAWSPGPRGPRVRYAPALNAFAMGFPVKILLTLLLAGAVYVAFPGIVDALATQAFRMMQGVTP